MIKSECEHEWIRHTNIKVDGNGPYYICGKCKVIMQASEVIQFEALKNQTKLAKHQMGFQKHIAVIAIIISFLALIISLFK